MTKIIRRCMTCGRTCVSKEDAPEGGQNVSDGYCARCLVEDSNLRKQYSRDDLFGYVKTEIEQGTEWGKGECPTADEEGRTLYENVYLKRARRMAETEAGVKNRRK